MAVTAEKVLNQARDWLGCNEEDNSFMDVLNTYNTIRPLPRGYAIKPWDEWCATFVSAVAQATGALDIIPAEVSCPQMINLFKKKGCWQENEAVTPKPGWVIFYDWNDNGVGDDKGMADHVGYVESVKDGIITTIEGNTGNGEVGRNRIEVNGQYIRGYGVPKYDVVKKDCRVAIVEYETVQGNKRYMNTYDGELSDTGYQGNYNKLLTIKTKGARGVYSAYDKKKHHVSGKKMDYVKTKGTHILVRVIHRF